MVNSYISKADIDFTEESKRKQIELTTLINAFYEKKSCFHFMFSDEIINRIDYFQ